MTTRAYVHGYSEREKERLGDQANALADLLHHDTIYPAGSRVLEAGCGVGAQTVILAAHSPRAHFTSVDISPQSIEQARAAVAATGAANVTFQVADIRKLPFKPRTFDHVFVCFTLEHLTDPPGALRSLRQMLKPGGTVTTIEGDHGSAYFHPDSRFAQQAIQCLVNLQAKAGGDSLIGRRLYPLLTATGFAEVVVSPRMVYADASRPELVEGFTRNTFTAMVEGVRERALAAGLMSTPDWEQGIRDLYRTAESDGTFCYTFFKARGIRR
ncbi:MAG: methyltransferase domain-containing protein [Phycisphaerae bacterium]|nr:methyltransferase domain-containing protein [Phycisphaerae bacterium]